MTKKNVYLAQVNSTYGKGCFLPYSVGLLQAYAETIPEIKEAYDFKELIYLRENVVNLVGRMKNPDVVGISCYIWNFEWSMAFAKIVKTTFPQCLIVLGGPHVPMRPDATTKFFKDHPYVDMAVHHEGEEVFAEILKGRLEGHPSMYGRNGQIAIDAKRVADLSAIPSPYLAGVFDGIINGDNEKGGHAYEYQATQETHRGCPFACTFCDWGSSVMTKVRRFPQERLYDEFDWMARNRIGLLYNADANYAMYADDVPLTQRLVDTKKATGYPQKFRAAYAKNSGDRVFEVSKILNDAGMSKGTTLSFQSMDENTLELVKRKNIKMTNFKELIARYNAAGIPTYTELIIGLPGETYDSFANGIEQLLEAGVHSGLNVYTCELLPNSEMSEPAYIGKHGIRSAKVPVLFLHGSPQKDPHQEYYHLVTSTSTLPPDDWMKTQLFAWAVQAFHHMGLTQVIAREMHDKYDCPYAVFYRGLIASAAMQPSTLIGEAYLDAVDAFEDLRHGREWGWEDERFGNIVWPIEEGAFLHCVANVNRFYDECVEFFTGCMVQEQKDRLKKPSDYPDLTLVEFARDHCWYNRKGGTFLHPEKEPVNAPV